MCVGAVLELLDDPGPVVGVADAEHAVDVPERRLGLDQADGVDRLAQERVRCGLDRAGRVGLDQGLQQDGRAGAGRRVDAQRVDAHLGAAEVEVVHGPHRGGEAEA